MDQDQAFEKFSKLLHNSEMPYDYVMDQGLQERDGGTEFYVAYEAGPHYQSTLPTLSKEEFKQKLLSVYNDLSGTFPEAKIEVKKQPSESEFDATVCIEYEIFIPGMTAIEKTETPTDHDEIPESFDGFGDEDDVYLGSPPKPVFEVD